MPPSHLHTRNLNAVVAIGWAPGFEADARLFARQNKLPIINETSDWSGLCFCLDAAGWSLKEAPNNGQDVFVLQFTPKYQARGKDPLLRAMGKASTVLDMTAGWGADALHIAESGRTVIALERHPVVYQLLQQARSELNSDLKQRLKFLPVDAAQDNAKQNLTRLLSQTLAFDLVYIDPMFDIKPGSNAKTKRPMRLLQQLVKAPSRTNELCLFRQAMDIARKRVVVKRALKAPYLADKVPQGSIKSKLLRFDLYRPQLHNYTQNNQV